MSTDQQQFLIWSQEHGAWWLTASSGYTRNIFEAGKYSFKQATQIVFEANRYLEPGAELNEVAVFAIILNPE